MHARMHFCMSAFSLYVCGLGCLAVCMCVCVKVYRYHSLCVCLFMDPYLHAYSCTWMYVCLLVLCVHVFMNVCLFESLKIMCVVCMYACMDALLDD